MRTGISTRRITMITWLFLFSLICESTQDGHTQEEGPLHCGPQNLNLTISDQMLTLTWEDDRSCSALHDVLVYDVVVLIADQQNHYEEVVVMPEQIGSVHRWSWTSHLAMECASHSVRLRSRYKNHTSLWSELQEGPRPGAFQVYPRDKEFAVGSSVTFCCIVPAGQHFKRMYLKGYTKTTQISEQTYALTLHLNQTSGRCTDVICQTNESIYGACTYIGYPPDDRDLRCETRDLESVECHWTVGRDTQISRRSPTKYQLNGRPCDTKGRCSPALDEKVEVGEKNWTLTAKNSLGEVELHDRADLTRRVHMFAPEAVTATAVNARNISLQWRWSQQRYHTLRVTCQVNVSHGGTNTTKEHVGLGLNDAVIQDLVPDSKYDVMVRCGTAQHFWKWGDWSKSVSVHTKGDVPDALDVWMKMKGNQTVIVWKKPLANQSHGHIIDYEVVWTKTGQSDRHNRIIPHNQHSPEIIVDTSEEHMVTVTARNMYGSSSPSTITIPGLSSGQTTVNTSRITGTNGSFALSWSASSKASCGYIVDWHPTFGKGTVEWLKTPPNSTNANVFSKDFRDGLRYSLSAYACTQAAPVLLERWEGYVRERRMQHKLFEPLTYKQQDLDVEVSWTPIPLSRQTAFIQRYILYYSKNSNTVFNVSTVDPEATSLTARNLRMGSYTFTVAAQTAVGECGISSMTVTLNSLTDNLIMSIFLTLGTVFVLLSLTTILCYRYWACIKHKVYPPIPKPVLTDKWVTSPGDHGCSCRHVSHLSEADIPADLQLCLKPGAPLSSYISQEDTYCTYTQAPTGYHCTPPPITVPAAVISPPSGLPRSPFRCVFPNPTYNPTMLTGYLQSSPGSEVQEGTPAMENSSGYQPQSPTDTFSGEEPDSPMSCVSTYILLPQTPAT